MFSLDSARYAERLLARRHALAPRPALAHRGVPKRRHPHRAAAARPLPGSLWLPGPAARGGPEIEEKLVQMVDKAR